MTGTLRSLHRARSRLLVLSAFLAVVGQLGAMFIAPVAEARASHSAPAHVEAAGTHRHHSHNPTNCAACLTLQQTALAPSVATAEPLPAERLAVRPATPPRVAAPSRVGPGRPRAPPAPRTAVR